MPHSPRPNFAPPGCVPREWAVQSIIAESPTMYRIQWEGFDPKTRSPWKPTWEYKVNVSESAVTQWERLKETREHRAARVNTNQNLRARVHSPPKLIGPAGGYRAAGIRTAKRGNIAPYVEVEKGDVSGEDEQWDLTDGDEYWDLTDGEETQQPPGPYIRNANSAAMGQTETEMMMEDTTTGQAKNIPSAFSFSNLSLSESITMVLKIASVGIYNPAESAGTESTDAIVNDGGGGDITTLNSGNNGFILVDPVSTASMNIDQMSNASILNKEYKDGNNLSPMTCRTNDLVDCVFSGTSYSAESIVNAAVLRYVDEHKYSAGVINAHETTEVDRKPPVHDPQGSEDRGIPESDSISKENDIGTYNYDDIKSPALYAEDNTPPESNPATVGGYVLTTAYTTSTVPPSSATVTAALLAQHVGELNKRLEILINIQMAAGEGKYKDDIEEEADWVREMIKIGMGAFERARVKMQPHNDSRKQGEAGFSKAETNAS